jgi:hypothetical protein
LTGPEGAGGEDRFCIAIVLPNEPAEISLSMRGQEKPKGPFTEE